MIANWAIVLFIFIIASDGHPWAIAGAACVILPEIPPSAHTIFSDIGIAKIAI